MCLGRSGGGDTMDYQCWGIGYGDGPGGRMMVYAGVGEQLYLGYKEGEYHNVIYHM